MAESPYSVQARRWITERCLIAADIDKTIVAQGEERERPDFLRRVGPQLIQSAKLGAQLAFISGNAMHEVADRFLRWLIQQLCWMDEVDLLDRFSFFCNSGGVYVRLPYDDEGLQGVLSARERGADPGELHAALFAEITQPGEGPRKLAIRPRFVDAAYVERCRVAEADVAVIKGILVEEGAAYLEDLRAKQTTYAKQYSLDMVSDGGQLKPPAVELRYIAYGSDADPRRAIVQITLKPALSFHQASKPSQVFGKDLRSKLVDSIQRRLDAAGLAHYEARPGGRVSIDVTLGKLDKAYALEFLIDRLNLQGGARQGQQFGSNTIYFGDEVIAGGGNDFAVTRIPGLLVFAVNPRRELVPLMSHVLVPSTILEGPDATALVLTQFNQCAERMLRECRTKKDRIPAPFVTAVEALKAEIFSERTRAIMSRLSGPRHTSVEHWQALHTLATLMARDDPAARQWLSILITEMHATMLQFAVDRAEPSRGRQGQ